MTSVGCDERPISENESAEWFKRCLEISRVADDCIIVACKGQRLCVIMSL